MGNTFGRIFRLFTAIDSLLAQRRPSNYFETTRREPDRVRFLSGIKEGVTLGTPIAFIVENQKHNSAEYDELKGDGLLSIPINL